MASFMVVNLGCPKNQVDSEIMIACLESLNLRYEPQPDRADIIIVNTCAFIGPAKEESIETCLSLRRKYPHKVIIIAGCLAQRYGSILEKELSEIDSFLFSRNPEDIGPLVDSILKSRGYCNYHLLSGAGQPGQRTRLLSYPGSIYIKIASGCHNRCSYCAIPLIKGKLCSRARDSIIDEIKFHLKRGIYEFCIVAHDSGSFGLDRGRREIGDLLLDLERIDADFWIRFLYLHPDRFPGALIDTIRRDNRFLPYFDIPFQHSSAKILRAMHRRGNAGEYLKMIEWIRREIPEAIIRSTFLVGFPGEDEDDFKDLMDFQDKARLDWLGIFTYSREEGTDAYNYKGRVRQKEAEKRKELLQQAQVEITGKRLDSFVGRVIPVLIEEPVRGEDCWIARGFPHAPEVDGVIVLRGSGFKPGLRVAVRIVRRNGFDLEAIPAW